MKKIVIFLTSTFLFANSLLDIYRQKGIKPIEEIFENTLQSYNFWYDRIKNMNVKYGYFEKPTFILIGNKKNKTLKVFLYKDGNLTLLKEFHNIITGKMGDKQKEGDLKTPIGNYTLIKRFRPKNTFYGPLAFVTSYPNLYDILHHKNGYGIWIHGKPFDGERGDKSRGCLVLNNDEILLLDKLIDYKNSVLLITEHPLFANKEEISAILSMLYRWRYAWMKSDLEKYLSFYSKDFHRSNGTDFNSFKKMKKRVFLVRKNQPVQIYFLNIQITPYQNNKLQKIYKIDFFEKYYAPNYKFEGNKEIFVQKEDNQFKIIIEK